MIRRSDKWVISIAVLLLLLIVGLNVFVKEKVESPEMRTNVLTGAVTGLAEEGEAGGIAEADIGILQTIANCWDTTHSASQTACETDPECKWHTDPWGSWCEQKGCWNFFDSTSCGQTNNASSTLYYINKSCSWTSSSSGWCMETDCWSLSGTTQAACESNSYGLNCSWTATYSAANYDYPCTGPPEKNCWSQTTQAVCTNITGCKWGICEKISCWDQTSSSACIAATGYSGNACKWNGQYSYCYESGCWDYINKTACEAASCKWDGGMCFQPWCSDFGYVNESYCVNNTANLNCQWNNPWCEEKGCWNYGTSATCGAANSSRGTPCLWQTYDGGWCEEVGCWNWDYNKGGNEAGCLANGTYYSLNCTWANDTATAGVTDDGWCYEDISSAGCGDITKERDCIDTMYCFWNYSSSACQDPTGTLATDFVEWYPGCWVFDFTGQWACENVTGCSWASGVPVTATSGPCRGNATINNTDPTIGGIRCEYINYSELCTNMTMLPHCCEWQGGSCSENKFSTKCWDQMPELPEGATFCEDYNAYTDKTLCEQIAGGPWYLPCHWDNMSTTDEKDDRCTFKFGQVFETGKENLIYLDSEKACGSAGGKWVVDMYASSTDPTTAVALPMGHCEEDFGGKRNCNTDCHACDYKSDGTNHSTVQKAESACYGSLLGMCEFNASGSAPNGRGYCRQKDEFKKGIAKDCDDDCGSCTFMGSTTSAEPEKRPSYYCRNSKVTGGCKWIPDLDTPNDESKGRCAKTAEKTCEDKCDLCNEEVHCVNYGKKKGNTSMDTQCTWNSITNTCSLTTGGAQMEICWDGIDNNNDGKMDCADSMCYSDPFCGGGCMAGFGGMDCFGYDTQSPCETGGCVWINENWGSWCDMPGANCWSHDGDETACGLDDNCSWHSGFGGFCEENWTMMGSTTEGCMSYNSSDCAANITNNCTWVVDSYYSDMGGEMGWCDPDWNFNYSAGETWVDCVNYDDDGSTICEAAATNLGNTPCNWYTSGGGTGTTYGGGWCDHMNYACWQFHNQSDCEEATNATYNHSEFCIWRADEWGSWCEGKKMGGTGSTDSCWNQGDNTTCIAAGCNWVEGFCDPAGFGSDMGFGGMAGGADFGGTAMGTSFQTMGGTGMNCMKYDGNQTGCEATQGCSWFSELQPFCDVNFETHCPEFSYNSTICNSKPRCVYNPTNNFCDEKVFSCFWNSSLTAGEAACEATGFCHWTSWNSCEPICFNSTIGASTTSCQGGAAPNVTNGTTNFTACRWVDGWCNAGCGAKYFKEMEAGAPIPLGTDTRGDVSPPEIDIVSFGMKDMGPSFGFGITVDDVENASMCNGVKLFGDKTGLGYNTTKFYWYLDTDGSSTGNCNTQDSNNLSGFEFYFKGAWSWGNSAVVETLEAYKCESGSWKKAPIPLTSFAQKACKEVGGGTVVVEKVELEKFPTLYTTGMDMRVYVATANNTGNVTNPTDTLASADIGYATPGAFDQDISSLDLFKFKNASKKVGEGTNKGYIEYADVDCWTEAGCADYQCKDHPYCKENSYGVEAAGFTDTRVPKIVGVVIETYCDSAIIKFWTDKPSNGSLEYFGPSAGCPVLSTPYVPFSSINNESGVRNHTLEHLIEITADNMGGSLAANGTTGYFKLTFCDNESKCGISQCTKIIYETCGVKGAFDNFVTKIEAPTGWNVSYDKDQNEVYEHDQNAFIATTNKSLGMKTNYSDGRRANIKLVTDDNSSWIEFIDVKLTKTGIGGSTIRKVDDAGAFLNGTTTDAAGNTLGYVGMIEETRDQIVNNLFPEKCLLKFPKGDTGCTELWHCNDEMTKCVNRTAEATLNETGTDYCIWEIPYCEFSPWGGGDGSGSPPGGGTTDGGGAGAAAGVVCTVGAISCQGTAQYKECLASGTKNAWSEVKDVPAGKICKGGKLVAAEEAAEEEEAVAEVKEKAPEEAVPEEVVAEELAEVKPPSKVWETITGLSWLWVTLVVIIIGAIAFFRLRRRE